MSINNTIEALNTPVTQQAYIDLVGLILREQQTNTANGNVQYNWLGNALTDVSRIMLADSYRVLGIDSIQSTSNWSNSLIITQGSAYYDTGTAESYNVMPGNVGANVFITNSYNILVPEKDFRFANAYLNTNTITKSYLENYSTSILANSNVYSNLSIRTGIDYAIANNYYNYSNFDSNSFVIQQDTDTVDSALELVLGITKSTTIRVLGGGI
jgi:hypothetical protein